MLDVSCAVAQDVKPVVLRGLVRDWPIVQQTGPQAVCDYLKRFDNGSKVVALVMPPEVEGLASYRDDMNGFTFTRQRLPLEVFLDRLLLYHLSDGVSLAAQGELISECLPGFLDHHPPPLNTVAQPRIWLNNRLTVPAHFDETHNIAVCVSGRRRFTLFPPEQVENMYVGPLDCTPAGPPTSVASRAQPDLDRYPRYRYALAASISVDLEPGDAVCIPPLWWHQVESPPGLNILINYWDSGNASPTDALIYSLLTIGGLDVETRLAWKAIFNHLVFNTDSERLAHIRQDRLGVLGQLTPEQQRLLKDELIEHLKGQP